jgi:hypothetical protein
MAKALNYKQYRQKVREAEFRKEVLKQSGKRYCKTLAMKLTKEKRQEILNAVNANRKALNAGKAEPSDLATRLGIDLRTLLGVVLVNTKTVTERYINTVSV